MGKTLRDIHKNNSYARIVLTELRFNINEEKSVLTPTKKLKTFTSKMTVSPTENS